MTHPERTILGNKLAPSPAPTGQEPLLGHKHDVRPSACAQLTQALQRQAAALARQHRQAVLLRVALAAWQSAAESARQDARMSAAALALWARGRYAAAFAAWLRCCSALARGAHAVRGRPETSTLIART